MRSVIVFVFSTFWLLNYAQNRQAWDVLHAEAEMDIFPAVKTVKGIVDYDIKILRKTDSIVFDAAKEVKVLSVQSGHKKIYFEHKENRLILREKFTKGKRVKVRIQYESQPKQAMYFTSWNTPYRKQVWTQGQGKNNSHWMPGSDDQNEKFTWKLTIGFPAGYRVISNGELVRADTLDSERWKWTYHLSQPASFYLMFIGAGKYDVFKSGVQGVHLEHYFYPDEPEGIYSYRLSDTLFAWMQKQMGVKYPWGIYREIPLKNFFYGGMENVTSSVFSDEYYVNDSAWTGSRTFNILAHELAHQWLGNLVTAVSSRHHWIHESFATFWAYEAEKHFLGNDFHQWKKYRSFKTIYEEWKNGDTIPLMNPKASSLTFYTKGARILEMMRGITEKENFKKVIQHFIEKNKFKNATTSDFKKSLYAITGDSLNAFFNYWFKHAAIPEYTYRREEKRLIVQAKHPWPVKVRLFRRSKKPEDIVVKNDTTFILPEDYVFFLPNPGLEILSHHDWQLTEKELFSAIRYPLEDIDFYRILKQFSQVPYERKKALLYDIAKWDYYYPVYIEVLKQLPEEWGDFEVDIFKEMIKKSGEGKANLLYVLNDIFPDTLKPVLVDLLQDKSYEVIKQSLYLLIRRFPQEAHVFLKITDGKGMHQRSKNLRILWLAMALHYQYGAHSQREKWKQELYSYTEPGRDVMARITAFHWLTGMQIKDDELIDNAQEANKHFHRFLRRFANEYLKITNVK